MYLKYVQLVNTGQPVIHWAVASERFPYVNRETERTQVGIKAVGTGTPSDFLLASPLVFLVTSWQEALKMIIIGLQLTMAVR